MKKGWCIPFSVERVVFAFVCRAERTVPLQHVGLHPVSPKKHLHLFRQHLGPDVGHAVKLIRDDRGDAQRLPDMPDRRLVGLVLFPNQKQSQPRRHFLHPLRVLVLNDAESASDRVAPSPSLQPRRPRIGVVEEYVRDQFGTLAAGLVIANSGDISHLPTAE